MSLLAPAALALAFLAVPIVLLYMLRLRRRQHTVSSTWLWRELVRDRAANAPWQRLRRNLLLLLQLLALAVLVLALARPALPLPGLAAGSVIVLLDASASMQATDTDGTRFAAAQAAAARLIGGLSGGDRLTLIRVGRTPEVLATASSDRAVLRRVLADAEAENSGADWPAAFALALGSTRGLDNPRIVIISDGGLPPGLPSLPGEVTFIPIGRAADNLAIAAQAARQTPQGTELLVVAANHGETTRSALLSVAVDGVLYDSRRLELAAGEQASQSWTLPAGAVQIATRLEPRDGMSDFLPLDDRAWTVVGSDESRRVLLLSDGNLFLERFFAVLPGYTLYRSGTAEGQQAIDDEPFDLIIYDSVPVPEGVLPGNSLIFNPQSPVADTADANTTAPLLTVTGVMTDTTGVRISPSPLLENVDWRSFSVATAQRVETTLLEPLVEAADGPLLLAGEANGRRVAVFTFDLRASDLPLQIAFPVVMANITAWLSPGRVIAADDTLLPGNPVTLLPNGRATRAAVALPDGSQWEQVLGDADGPVVFGDTWLPGIYRVSFATATGEAQPGDAFAVNFFDAGESRIQPLTSLQVGQAEVTAAEQGFAGLRELWPWLLAAGLIVLLVEWWITYQRPLFKLR